MTLEEPTVGPLPSNPVTRGVRVTSRGCHRPGSGDAARPTTTALGRDDPAVDQDLAAPHAVGLAAFESAGEAELTHRAVGTQRLGRGQLGRVLGEEQVRSGNTGQHHSTMSP